MLKITLKDGHVMEVEKETTIYEVRSTCQPTQVYASIFGYAF